MNSRCLLKIEYIPQKGDGYIISALRAYTGAKFRLNGIGCSDDIDQS